jgi:hypothetical protein
LPKDTETNCEGSRRRSGKDIQPLRADILRRLAKNIEKNIDKNIEMNRGGSPQRSP